MGVVVSLLYFVTYYITPTVIFGQLADYHIELIVAILASIVSLPALGRSYLFKTPQTLALAGLAIATFASALVEMRWAGGGVKSLLLFIPNAFGYVLVVLHFNSKKKLQVLVLTLMLVCLFVIARGRYDLSYVVSESHLHDGTTPESPYVLIQSNGPGSWFYRLMGQGEIADPNDFAQLTICVIPLVFIFWRQKKLTTNILFVVIPVCALLYGVFLTHSRGGVMALAAVAVVALRRRIGTIPSLIMGGGFVLAAVALNVTGGRGISTETGADRTGLWSDGLQILKAHPIFGVGLGNMPDYTGHTAHNSIVVCAAELGILGLYFWSLCLVPTLRDAAVLSSRKDVTEAEPTAAKVRNLSISFGDTTAPLVKRKDEQIDKADINELGLLILMSLVGFLSAGWFLSRSFVMTLFILAGIAEVIYEMAMRLGMVPPRLPWKRVLPYAGGVAFLMVLTIYVMLRTVNLTR
jgi:O-antigen ligase